MGKAKVNNYKMVPVFKGYRMIKIEKFFDPTVIDENVKEGTMLVDVDGNKIKVTGIKGVKNKLYELNGTGKYFNADNLTKFLAKHNNSYYHNKLITEL